MTLSPASVTLIGEKVEALHEATHALAHWHLLGLDKVKELCLAISNAQHAIHAEINYNAVRPRRELVWTQPTPRVPKTVSIDDL